jgi:serine/threonine protein kinase
MVLGAGARLGPYEIISALGAGGMGEVYRACDTRLDRIVCRRGQSPGPSAAPTMDMACGHTLPGIFPKALRDRIVDPDPYRPVNRTSDERAPRPHP